MKYDLDLIMETAKRAASKSLCRYKVSCVLVDERSRIISVGVNHWKNGKSMGRYTVHAEIAACNKVMKMPRSNLIAFIYRANSRNINPCNGCAQVLKSYGITRVYCVNDGWWVLQ
jgi:cytidine deaminase